MQTIQQSLAQANTLLSAASPTPSLDAEILLAHLLKTQRSYLYSHPNQLLSESLYDSYLTLLEKRTNGHPIPYLTGHCEFWSLDLIVTPDTLIPRPETELLVELILKHPNHPSLQIADLGTGSGAIALALAHERPQWHIHATDLSFPALTVAKLNSNHLKIPNITFNQGHWFDALPNIQFDIIVSNPPYIAEDDPHLEPKVLATEPTLALISAENGLKDLYHIINQAKKYLKPGGQLLLEHGFTQAELVQQQFLKAGYKNVQSKQDFSGLNRVTSGFFEIYFGEDFVRLGEL